MTASKAPSAETMVDLHDQLLTERARVFGTGADLPEQVFATTFDALASAVAGEAGVTTPTARRYVREFLDQPDCPIVQVNIRYDGEVSATAVDGQFVSHRDAGLTTSTNIWAPPYVSASLFLMPWVPSSKRKTDHVLAGTYLVNRETLREAVQSSIDAYEAREQEYRRERSEYLHGFDQKYPGLRLALAGVTQADGKRVEGANFDVYRADDGGDSLHLMLTDPGAIQRLHEALTGGA